MLAAPTQVTDGRVWLFNQKQNGEELQTSLTEQGGPGPGPRCRPQHRRPPWALVREPGSASAPEAQPAPRLPSELAP